LKSDVVALNGDLASSKVGSLSSLAYLSKYSPLPFSILKAPDTHPEILPLLEEVSKELKKMSTPHTHTY